MAENQRRGDLLGMASAPRGLAVFEVLGPSIVWAAEYIGSGEVILATRTGAILDGLLLTPLQALLVAIGLFWVMPKLLSKQAAGILRPNAIFGVILIIAFIVFGYFCIFQIPSIL